MPRAILHSMKILSNDKILTGLFDRVYSSYNVQALNPKRSFIVSSNIKLIIGPCGDVSVTDPNVKKLGLIVNG